ncbi:TSUP family transporter [Thermus tengchongensis]|uniref:Probable membrane transporter protein n=1 Tax=Thermus tengchongensis TaxID=1214928 RepID=A0A4Y9F7V4_9DEIN|nr:TSUP family transporter [Thermus tengchongensis]TFU25246.1 sulfite exporter TauE/SafE family protein [Thermus tengchongensis]
MAFVLGFFIAFAIGVTGVGQGTLTAPLLILLLGLPPEEAVGTALLFGALIKVPASAVYLLRGGVDRRALGLLLLGGGPGALLGALALAAFREARDLVLLLVGLTVALSAGLGLVGSLRGRKAWERLHLLPPAALGIGLLTGFSSAGTGSLGNLLLLHATRLPPQQVVGTVLLFGQLLALLGGGVHLGFGHVRPELLLPLVLGGLLGASLGALLSTRLPPKPLRVALLLWLLLVGGQLAYRGGSVWLRSIW